MNAAYIKYLDKSLHPHPSDIVALAQEILKLRTMLWLSHGHTTGRYGDDGELQCSECLHEYGFYDWKRTDITEIEEKIAKANMKKLANMPVCQHGHTHKCSECAADKAWG